MTSSLYVTPVWRHMTPWRQISMEFSPVVPIIDLKIHSKFQIYSIIQTKVINDQCFYTWVRECIETSTHLRSEGHNFRSTHPLQKPTLYYRRRIFNSYLTGNTVDNARSRKKIDNWEIRWFAHLYSEFKQQSIHWQPSFIDRRWVIRKTTVIPSS